MSRPMTTVQEIEIQQYCSPLVTAWENQPFSVWFCPLGFIIIKPISKLRNPEKAILAGKIQVQAEKRTENGTQLLTEGSTQYKKIGPSISYLRTKIN